MGFNYFRYVWIGWLFKIFLQMQRSLSIKKNIGNVLEVIYLIIFSCECMCFVVYVLTIDVCIFMNQKRKEFMLGYWRYVFCLKIMME